MPDTTQVKVLDQIYKTSDTTIMVHNAVINSLGNLGLSMTQLLNFSNSITDFLYNFDKNIYPKAKDQVKMFAFKLVVTINDAHEYSIDFNICQEACEMI